MPSPDGDRAWTLSPDEFAWLWQQCTGLDAYGYPDPLRVRERAATVGEHAELVAGFGTRHAPAVDPVLAGALVALSDPDSRIRCHGSVRAGPDLRVVGVRAGALGVVAVQQDATVTLIAAAGAAVPRRIAQALPATVPGAAGSMRGSTERVRGTAAPASWIRDQRGRIPVDERIRALLRLPRGAEGQLVVETGLRAPHRSPPRYLSWIDVAEQTAAGRYLVEVDAETTLVRAAGTAELTAHLHSSTPFARHRQEKTR